MARSDASIFMENLRLWDRPLAELRGHAVLQVEDNVDRIVDELFERFADLELDGPHPFVGHC
ncbi:MAG: hypothetical protein JXR96_19295 [Deltaproteobacteria bacterium]|nr:hypothetical protein [Deltaproteobacteria bacterium]